jgi:hypothetical protein
VTAAIVSSVVDPLHDPEPGPAVVQQLERGRSESAREPLGLGGLLVSVVFAAAVSLVAGVITGFVHGQLPPWGLLGGMAVTGALIVGFGLVFESRAAAAAAAVGVLAGGVLLTLPGAGPAPVHLEGTDAWLGWVWLLWPVVVELAVLLEPFVRRRRSQERPPARP